MSAIQPHPWPEEPAAGPLGDGRFASARFRPESLSELCQAITESVRDGMAVYPQGGGTSLNYGNPPGRPGVAVDLPGLGRVIDYPHADMTITVEAGISSEALRATLAEKKQRLLVDIPQADRATLGGVYATGTCGPRRYGVGRPRDQIIGVSFVGADGVEVKGGGRVVKNVAGYDFPKLLSGSLGTLGIITQMTLKVRPIPESSALVWVPLDDLDTVAEALEKLNTSDTRPIAIELLSEAVAAPIASKLGLASGPWVLAVGLEDSVASVRWQVSRLSIELGRAQLSVCEEQQAVALWSELVELPAAAPGPLDATIAVPPSRLVALLDGVEPTNWTVQSHAGSGIIRLKAIGDWTLERAAAALERLRTAAVAEGGSLVVTRCPAGWKARISVWGPRRPDWVLAEKVKRALDPAGVFNPGRFVGGI